MGIFSKLFGKKATPSPSSPAPAKPVSAAPSTSPAPGAPATPPASDLTTDPNLIKVFDDYGRELFISKEQWLGNVLLGNLEKHRDDPDALYGMLIAAFKDGFAAEVISYAEHLYRIDPTPSRGVTVLGIAYLQSERLDDAEQVLEEYLDMYGDEGIVLTNLAKVYSQRGEEERADELLWHALQLDPNQDNGLLWFASRQRERGGESAELEAFREVAELPGSWRAHLWLARHALRQDELAEAEAEYLEALEVAGEPTPPDLLMQLTGDLGNAGRLEEVVRLAGPYYDPVVHGIEAGNNLLKANLELGRLEQADRLLRQLYALNRPDWGKTLAFWETELAKADTARRAAAPQAAEPSITALSIEGPIWMRHGAPFAALLPAKSDVAPRFVVFGSTVLGKREEGGLQLSDAAGRLSRSIPMLMAEVIQVASEAVGVALIPWAQGQGFAVFGRPYDDEALCLMSGSGDDAPDYVIGVTIDAGEPEWKVMTRLIRRGDGERLAEMTVEVNRENPGAAIYQLCADLSKLLAARTGVRMTSAPSWYQLPVGNYVADYLLRLEQQLSVSCQTVDYLEGGGLYGEREILDGTLRLCVDQPKNSVVRMLYAQTLRLMNKVRPEIVAPYREKTGHLWRDYPMDREIEPYVFEALKEVFGA